MVNATATGDPHIATLNGSAFDFAGTNGGNYQLFAVDSLSAVGTVATCDPDGNTILSQVKITIPGHTLTVESDGIIVDGVKWTTSTPSVDWLAVRPHRIGSDGYAEVHYEGGTVGVHRADGTDPEAVGTFLDGLFYCQVFISGPDSWSQGSGVMASGTASDTPEAYRVNQSVAAHN